MKRTTAVLVALFMLAQLFVFSETTSVYAVSSTNELYKNRLEALDVIPKNIKDDELFTRSDLAYVVSNMFYGNVPEFGAKSPYVDVPQNHSNINGILSATALGFMTGDDNRRFRPDDYVSYQEVAKVFVCVTGYDYIAKQNEGYPMGYWNTANSNKIIPSGIVSMGDPVTFKNLVHMVYKTLEIPVMEAKYGSKKGEYAVNGDFTLLGSLLKSKDMNFARGIVTSDGITYLRENKGIQDNTVIIDDFKLINHNFDVSPLIGYPVEYFYNNTDSGEASELVSIYQYSEVNVRTYAAKDIISASIGSYSVRFGDKSKTKNETFSKDVAIIYNGQGLPNFTANDLKPANGSVTLIDSNNDEIIDVVRVWDKQAYVVETVGRSGYTVGYKKTYVNQEAIGLNIDEFDLGTVYIVKDKLGKKISPGAISIDSVISVGASKDGKIITVVVNKDRVSGEIQEFSDRNSITIASNTFEMGRDLHGMELQIPSTIEVGSNTDLYLDEDGFIIYINDKKVSSGQYAFILATGKTSSLAELKIKAAVATPLGSAIHQAYDWVRDKAVQNTLKTYELAPKVNIGVQYSNGTIIEERYSATAAKTKELIDGQYTLRPGEANYKIVKFSLNEENKVVRITKIEPTLKINQGKYANGIGAFVPQSPSGGLDNIALSLNGNVVGLAVPKPNKDSFSDITDLAWQSAYKIGSALSNWTVWAYDIPEGSQTPGLIVLQTDLKEGGDTANPYYPVGIINKPVTKYNDVNGELHYKFSVFDVLGRQANYIVNEYATVNYNNMPVSGNGSSYAKYKFPAGYTPPSIENFKVGDIVLFGYYEPNKYYYGAFDLDGHANVISMEAPASGMAAQAVSVQKVTPGAIWQWDTTDFYHILQVVGPNTSGVINLASDVKKMIYEYNPSSKTLFKGGIRSIVGTMDSSAASKVFCWTWRDTTNGTANLGGNGMNETMFIIIDE